MRPLLLVLALAGALAAQGPVGVIRGHVTDLTHSAIPGASVVLTAPGGAVVRRSADADGAFAFTALAPGRYQLQASATGFRDFTQTVTVAAGNRAPIEIQASLPLAAQAQTVVVRADVVKGATASPTQAQIFQSSQTIRVLDRGQINALSPTAGSAQIISITPGANITGYGNTGATKNTVTLNGVQQGWGGFGGFTTSGALGISFDGIPVADAATGLWQSNMFPQATLINDTSVVYGPGDPDQRWYDNVGGGVEYTPLQPSRHPHYSIWQTLGSYAQENTAFEVTSGLHRGWSAVLAGGHGSGNSFRAGSDGFKSPNHDVALYGKIIKEFQGGDLQFGAYSSASSGYRPQVLPVEANPAVTTNGQPGGPVYSQATSGFYSTVAFNTYNKYDSNLLNLFWSKLNLTLDPTTSLHNQVWYERINRLHDRRADVFTAGPQQLEWNNPFTKMYGDQADADLTLPGNTVVAGGFFIHSQYNSRANFYQPAAGGSSSGVLNAGGKARSSYFNNDMYAAYAQDRVTPWPWLSVTPGIRYFNNAVNYSSGVEQDFALAPGATLSSHCLLNGQFTSTPGTVDIQSASCAAHEARGGFEPSLDLAVHPRSWLSVYGGFSEELKAPQLGGGGGFFQGVDPASYQLARGEYSQGGVKLHFGQLGPVRRLLAGVSYFHLLYAGQEQDVGLANGDTISARASSAYKGVNTYADADATANLHLFLDATVERARYSSYVVGESVGANGQLQPGSIPFSGLSVPYVPRSLFNMGASYTLAVTDTLVVQPRVWYKYTGVQTIFDNSIGAPSMRAMPTFGTINLGANIPINWFDLRLTALNLTNRRYNQFVYITSGSYFNTPGGGYALAYPGAPFTLFATASVSF